MERPEPPLWDPRHPPGGSWAPPPPVASREGNRVVAVLAVLVVAVLLGAGASATVFGDFRRGVAAADNDQVRRATVRVAAAGTFVDPELGEQLNSAGSGSGFIIDPSGIAVTNNHVVTGAAAIEVFVAGEEAPRSATVVGSSECSDLAVIDIEGEGFAFLGFSGAELARGMKVFAAGFPDGDPQLRVTSGEVLRTRSDGESSWASVDGELQHDAAISPGSSGGPLVDAQGRVVGVNYASVSEEGPHFAIAASAAAEVVERLRAGEHVTYLGINGQAVSADDGTSGVWVAAVESGSPAAAVGLRSGDLITRMEGLAVGSDGTMADYCDVLRTQGSDGAIGLQVLRDSTQEILQGTLNDGDVLEPFQILTGAAEDGTSAGSEPAPSRYGEYTAVADDSDSIQLDVPVQWAEVDGAAVEIDGVRHPGLVAAPDLDGFFDTYAVPGVQIIGFDDTGAAQHDRLLDSVVGRGSAIGDSCVSEGRDSYEDTIYTGRIEVLNGCAGTPSSIAAIAAGPDDGTFAVLVILQLVSEADFEALNQVIATFVYEP